MSTTPTPPNTTDNPITEPEYRSAADEFALRDSLIVADDADDEDDDDEEGEGGKGDSKGRKKKAGEYDVKLDRAFLELDLDTGLDPLAALAEIINKLKLAAPSDIIRGASTFGPEHPDLTVRELGMLTKRIAPKHMADPHLLKKLDAAQKALRQREGISHPDDHLLNGDTGSTGIAGAAAAVGLLLSSMADNEKPQDKAKARREEAKAEAEEQLPAMDDMPYGDEPDYSHLVDPRTQELMSPPPSPDLDDILDMFDDDLQFDAPEHVFDTSVAATLDVVDRGQIATGPTTFDTMTAFFNAVVAYSEAPVERVTLRQELQLQVPEIAPQQFDM